MSSFLPGPEPRPEGAAARPERVTEERVVAEAEAKRRRRRVWRRMAIVVVVVAAEVAAMWFVWEVVRWLKR